MIPIASFLPILPKLGGIGGGPPGPPPPPPSMVIPIIIAVGVWLIAIGLLATVVYLILGLPLRRLERARMFLDLLDTGLAQGDSPERTIVDIAAARDNALGYRLHLLAAYLETGLRLSEAVNKVPGLVPPQVAAMLAIGEQTGDLRKMLPACRQTLTDGSSRVTSAVNYMMLIILVNPFGGLLWPFIAIVIVPKLQEMIRELAEGPMPAFLRLISAHAVAIGVVQVSLMVLVYLAMLIYICGPRGIPRLAPVLQPLIDRLNCRLPWRRKRLQRDFSAMLAQMLDAGMPEHEALTLAARSTDNRVFERYGLTAAERLRTGSSLTDAVEVFDDTGEFRWRLANAAQGHGGFRTALAGWHDTLGAQAYQLEQTASQIITTGIVIFNGCVIGLIAIGVFQGLTSVVVDLSLW